MIEKEVLTLSPAAGGVVLEATYRNLIAGLPAAIYTCDHEGRITFYNDAAARLWGREPELGKDLWCGSWRIYHLDGRRMPHEECPMGVVIREGRPASGEEIVVERPDGSRYNVLAYPQPIRNERGVVVGAVNTLVDITERKQAEAERERLVAALERANETLEARITERTEALRQSEQRFAQAFHAGPFAACLVSLEGELLEVNAAFSELTGYCREEAVGKTSQELRLWASPEDAAKLEGPRRRGESYRNLELQLHAKGNALRDILVSGSVIELDGQQVMLKQFYDITERKQTEEEVAEALQEALQDTAWFSRQVLDRLARIRSSTPQDASGTVQLTPREKQILERMAAGLSNRAIATELKVAEQTVRNYIGRIYQKLGVHSRAEAVVWARERGLTGR